MGGFQSFNWLQAQPAAPSSQQTCPSTSPTQPQGARDTDTPQSPCPGASQASHCSQHATTAPKSSFILYPVLTPAVIRPFRNITSHYFNWENFLYLVRIESQTLGRQKSCLQSNLKEHHLTTSKQPSDPKTANLCYQLRVLFDKRPECNSSQYAQSALSMHSSCSEPNGTNDETEAVTALIKSLH